MKSTAILMVLILSASLSGISNPNSSSSAITTSTVSKLSNPRSFWKWALTVTCKRGKSDIHYDLSYNMHVAFKEETKISRNGSIVTAASFLNPTIVCAEKVKTINSKKKNEENKTLKIMSHGSSPHLNTYFFSVITTKSHAGGILSVQVNQHCPRKSQRNRDNCTKFANVQLLPILQAI